MRFCRHCGNAVSLEARFCRSCGNALPPPTIIESEAAPESFLQETQAKAAQAKGTRPQETREMPSHVVPVAVGTAPVAEARKPTRAMPFQMAAVGAVVLLALGGGYFLWRGNAKASDTETTAQGANVTALADNGPGTPKVSQRDAPVENDRSKSSAQAGTTAEAGQEISDAPTEIVATPSPIPTQEPTPTSKPSPTPSFEFEGERFPQTRSHVLTESEISDWDYNDVRYAVNEIYARHGYDFKIKAIHQQFQKFAWYRPKRLSESQLLAALTPIERKNKELLAKRREQLKP